VINEVGRIALATNKGLKIPIVLSGDTHHYSRYVGDDGVTQFITSGGGGAFLHPTHQLEQTIDLNREQDGFSWLDGLVKTVSLGVDPQPVPDVLQQEARYPPRAESMAMLKGNFKFVAHNLGFAVLLGFFYWVLGLLSARLWWDGIYVIPIVLFIGFWIYTKRQEGSSLKVLALSAMNAVVHAIAVMVLAFVFRHLNAGHLDPAAWPRLSFLLFASEMIVFGGLVAGALFGLYLYASSRWWNQNHNDAFSAMRLDSYRSFLRMRIHDDEVTIYPIGLDKVPKRREWRMNTMRTGSPPPVYVPMPPLAPRLIEGPIVVKNRNMG
jgi:hypothetical protein